MDVLCVVAIPLAWKVLGKKHNERGKIYQNEAVTVVFCSWVMPEKEGDVVKNCWRGES